MQAKTFQPVTGSCRLINQYRISITIGDKTQEYRLAPLCGGNGYRLHAATGKMYVVNMEAHTCDCADATYRGRVCKHLKSVMMCRARGILA